MKKIFAIIAASAISFTALLCGCSLVNGTSGRDGADGKNASAYDYYELAKTIPGNENMTVDEFLREYLNYTPAQLEEAFGLQASINRSLRSAVTVAAQNTVYGSTITAFGSGVIVDLDKDSGDAYVITNCHVVYNDSGISSPFAHTVYLYLYGQDYDYNDADNRFNATVVGASITYDVALLKVTGSELLKKSNAIAAEFAEGDDIFVGEEVYTVGNAEGCGMAATRGVVTKDREIVPLNISERHKGDDRYTNYYTVMRTDAAINEGNSGGALFNREGKIVALVNSKSADASVEGMGYAIPASAVKRLVPMMIDNITYDSSKKKYEPYPTMTRAHFIVEEDFTKYEVGGDTVNLSVSNSFQVYAKGSSSYWNNETNRYEIREKVTVLKDCYGLQTNDLIKRVKILNGETVVEDMPVTRLYHLNDTLLSARQGHKVIITVERGGETVEVTAQMAYLQFN